MPGPQTMMTNLHPLVYRSTGGMIGGLMGLSPVGLLNTTGRVSGKERTTPLNFLPDGGNFVVVASNGGAAQHPDWYRNLEAQPEATFEVGPVRRPVRARTATGDERTRLWNSLVFMNPMYGVYASSTSREIPVVVLEPTDG